MRFSAVRRLDDDHLRQTGDPVGLFADVLAFDDVLEDDLAADLGENGRGERIPLDERLSRLRRLAVVHPQRRTVDQRVTLLLARRHRLACPSSLLGAVSSMMSSLPLRLMTTRSPSLLVTVETLMNLTLPGFVASCLRLLGDARGRTADVERTHGELRARLADRLGGDDADRFADLDQLAAGQIAAVAAAADAAPGLAGEHRADLDLLDAGFLNRVREVFGDLVVLRDELLAGDRIVDVFLRHAADDAVAKRLENVAAFHDRRDGDAVEGVAILLGDDDVLRHVDEPAREVAGVGGLERGVGQTFARAVGGDEVLQHGQAFAEVRGDRRLDDFARGLGHQAAHTGQLADLLLGASGAGVRHHEDGVELAAILLGPPHLAEHLVGNVLGGAVPDVDDLVVALAGGDGAVETLALDLEHRLAAPFDDLVLLRRDDHVVDADGDAGLGRVEEAELLEVVEHLHGQVVAEVDEGEVHQLLQAASS